MGGVTEISPLLKTLDIVIRGLRLAEAFAHTPDPMLPRRQIEAIFGPEQLRNTELLEAFARHLPGYVSANTPEVCQKFMECLILEDKLWEQLHVSLLKCFDPKIPFPDKLRIFMAFFDIFDVAFGVLKESTIIDWRSPDLNLLFGHLGEFEKKVAPGQFIRKAVHFRSIVFRGQFCHALLSQFSMRRRGGEPLLMEFSNSLTRLVGLLGVGTQQDMDSLIPGKAGGARTGFDRMVKAEAILTVTLRDGPLSNFCILGRLVFDVMASDMSDLTSDDTKRLWKTLERLLDDAPAPFADSSAAAWVRFDHLWALVRDPVLLGGKSQTVERLRPLLDMIEKVERIRPLADARTEGIGKVETQTGLDGSADPKTPQPGGPPIPGSSKQVEASHLETGGPMDPRVFPPIPGPDPLAGMGQFASRATSSTPITRPGLGAETQPPFTSPLHAPQVLVPPPSFPTPFMPGSGPRHSGPLGPPHQYTFPSPNFGPLDDGTPSGHVIQGSLVPMDWTGGYATPDAEAKESKCLYKFLRCR